MTRKNINYLLLIIAVITLMVLIKLSDMTLWSWLSFTGKIFIAPNSSYDLIENLLLGYLTSYIFYVLVVLLGEHHKTRNVQKYINYYLKIVINDFMLLLIHLYKNCSQAENWDLGDISDDSELIDSNFYKALRYLDVSKKADVAINYVDQTSEIINSLDFIKNKLKKPIQVNKNIPLENNINTYIYSKVKRNIESIDFIVSSQSPFFDDDMLVKALDLLNDDFLRFYIGESNKLAKRIESTNGKLYPDNFSLYSYYNLENIEPIFKNANGINLEAFKISINKILKIRKCIYKKETSTYAYKFFKQKIAGTCAIGRYDYQN